MEHMENELHADMNLGDVARYPQHGKWDELSGIFVTLHVLNTEFTAEGRPRARQARARAFCFVSILNRTGGFGWDY